MTCIDIEVPEHAVDSFFFFFLVSLGVVRLSPLGTSATGGLFEHAVTSSI
jgi:hypothetical protein